MSHPIRILIRAAAALIAAQTCFTTAQAATGTCNPTRVKFTTVEDQQGTTSTTFVNVPNTSLKIDVGGTSPSCVIVTFSAGVRVNNSIMYARAFIPGIGSASVAEPSSTFFADNSGVSFEANSMQFIFQNVPPGQRTVRIQYRSINGQLVAVASRTLTAQYRH